MTNEAMSEKEKCWHEFYNSKEAQGRCFGNYNNATRDESVGEFSFSGGWDACAKRSIDKEKLVEWLKAMESQCAKASFVEHTYDEVRQIIELGDFDLK